MKSVGKRILNGVIVVLVAGFMLLLLLPARQRIYVPTPRMQASNSLKQLLLAMHQYADTHQKRLPPPAIYSKDGKALLSWRVLLLPYIEQQSLYKMFRLDEPWDSPHNLALLPQMPPLFEDSRHPEKRKEGMTWYRVFVGPGAAFETGKGIFEKDFADGTGNTLMVVEAADAVPWTKPAELAFGPECDLPRLGGHFGKVFLASVTDGTFIVLPINMAEEDLRAAITRSGAEGVRPLFELQPGR
jgi:hypothetical protein